MIEVRYRIRPDVYLAADAVGGYTVVHGTKRAERLGRLDAAELDLLRSLATAPLPRPDTHGPLVDRLREGGWLTQHYGALLTVEPLGPHRVPRPEPLAAPRLSRFAVLRREGDALALEAPRSPARILVHDDTVVTLLHRLVAGGPVPDGVASEVVALLAWYGFVHEDGAETTAEAEQWSPHELWFHARSRAGHHDLPFGATSWADGRHPPLPARREPWPGPPIRLPTGDLPAPLGETLNARRSVRGGDDAHPLTLAQLGGFLHWTAGVREVRGDLTWRPSPAGGALHSLEIYPVVVRMADLAPGMYHYDPFGHLLEPVPVPAAALRQLTGAATVASVHSSEPQVVFVLAARFGRVMRKYQSMAYALVLKEVGALMQTMYLVATAMNLAPCALGAGDADLFAAATGLDPREEASVGEFILSTLVGPTMPS